MTANLWPDFDTEQSARTPKNVIEEAGAGLQERTNGEIEFSTETFLSGGQVTMSGALHSKRLSYFFPFMIVKFPASSLYPVTLTADKLEEMAAHDEATLIAALTQIFNAPTTIETVKQLMAYGQSPKR